jgi:hypothetical protein
MKSATQLSDAAEARFWRGVEAAGRFFMAEADVQKALDQLVQLLDAHAIPYAIVGAMALNEFGYQRTTVDVSVLLTPEGLAAFRAHALGRGYSEKFPGSPSSTPSCARSTSSSGRPSTIIATSRRRGRLSTSPR